MSPICPTRPDRAYATLLLMSRKGFPYDLRARFVGVVDWLCPKCGLINRTRVVRKSWRLRCKGKDCNQAYTIGMLFKTLTSRQKEGSRTIPPPDVAFPNVPLRKWANGGRVSAAEDD